MRWLFLLLVIINLGIFTWSYQREQQEQQAPIAAGIDIGNMRLLNEAKEAAEPEPTVNTYDDTTARSEETTQETGPVAEPEPTVVSTEAPVVAVPEEQETEAKIEATQDQPLASQDSVAADLTPEKKPEPQDTSSENNMEPDATNPLAEQKITTDEPDRISRCGTIGPVKDRQVAKVLVEELKRSQVDAKVEHVVEKQQIGFWVVIPPLEDGSKAQDKIAELTKVGLKDIWHFRGGGLKNAISLGMFSKKENAENYSRELQKKGFKTEMRPRYLNKTRYLVKFSIRKSETLTRLTWRRVERKYSKMPFSEQSCEPILPQDR